MILIFEGPDRVGKSTIASRMSEILNIPVFKRSLDEIKEKTLFTDNKFNFKDAMIYDQTYIVDFLKQTNTSVIFDRAFPSEYVYSKVFNRETNEEILELVDKKFSELNTFIIICLRMKYKYDDEFVNKDNIKLLHDMYKKDFYIWTKCNTIKLYTDSECLSDEISQIMQFIVDKSK